MADTQYIMNCPACGKEMKKIFVEEAGINVDICLDGCGGMLFDNRELEKVDEAHENADKIFEAIKDKEFEPVNTEKPRICPVCNAIMVKNGAANGEVKIDVCNVCGAKFLDNGELQKIRDYANREMETDVKKQIIYDDLEETTTREAMGLYGVFVNSHFKTSQGRLAAERVVNKFINSAWRHVD